MKKMKMLAAALLFCLSGNAQDKDSLRFIEATGSFRQAFVPDVIVMDFTLKGEIPQHDSAMTDREVMLDNLLKSEGVVPEKQLYKKGSLYYAQLFPYPGNRSKDFQLIVYDLHAAAAIFGALEDAGMESVEIVRIDCRNKTEYRKNMRLKALENAREEAMAEAGVNGKSVGSATLILEEDFYDYPDQDGFRNSIIPSVVARKRDYLNDHDIKVTYVYRIKSEFAVK